MSNPRLNPGTPDQSGQSGQPILLACDGERAGVHVGFTRRFAILPQSPQDSEPAVRQDAVGVSIRIAMGGRIS